MAGFFSDMGGDVGNFLGAIFAEKDGWQADGRTQEDELKKQQAAYQEELLRKAKQKELKDVQNAMLAGQLRSEAQNRNSPSLVMNSPAVSAQPNSATNTNFIGL